MDIASKRKKEKKVVKEMILMYCRGNHHTIGLCEDCQKLADYAWLRIDKCPFMENKTFCSNCKVHCYQPEMRERIRKVMRYSGPRMIFTHPVMAIHHVIATKIEKVKLKKQSFRK